MLSSHYFGKVGVLMGGKSREREISLRSGRAVRQALLNRGFDVEAIDLKGDDFAVELERHAFDFAFIALHGRGGEDGEIQTVLERRGTPYLGSDPVASYRAFDKAISKKIFLNHGISTPRYQIFQKAERNGSTQGIRSKLKLPVFLKPTEEGSSIDVYLAERERDFHDHLAALFSKYSLVLAEEKAEGREITVGIMGKRPLPVVEIRTKRKFYDYVAKYSKGMTEYFVPASLPRDVTLKVQESALRAHRALGLRDFSRIDMILSDKGPCVLEANTIPGFTETSLLPKAAASVGINFGDLCLELIRIAFARGKHEAEKEAEVLVS